MTRAVLLTKQVPWPSDSGGRIREAHVVDLLLRGYDEVHVLGFGPPPPPPLIPPRVHVHAVPGPDTVRGVLRSGSVVIGRWFSAELARLVRELGGPEVHLHVGFPQMVVNVLPPCTVSSLDLHNVESDLLAQRARRHPRRVLRPLLRIEARRLAVWERRVASRTRVTCVSEHDRARLRALGVTAVVAANGASLPAAASAQPRDDAVVFVGALDWQPNVESLHWFCEVVWPRVRAARPAARASLVGRAPVASLRALALPGISVVGDVDAVEPWYAASRVAICPLLTGGGSRLKILEALAHGRPVLSTPLGAEGLEDLVGRGIVLAADAASFNDELVALLNDPVRCEELGATGREAVAADWSWPRTLAPMASALFPERTP